MELTKYNSGYVGYLAGEAKMRNDWLYRDTQAAALALLALGDYAGRIRVRLVGRPGNTYHYLGFGARTENKPVPEDHHTVSVEAVEGITIHELWGASMLLEREIMDWFAGQPPNDSEQANLLPSDDTTNDS